MRMSCKATSRRCASQRNGSIVLGASILEAKDHIRERLGSSRTSEMPQRSPSPWTFRRQKSRLTFG